MLCPSSSLFAGVEKPLASWKAPRVTLLGFTTSSGPVHVPLPPVQGTQDTNVTPINRENQSGLKAQSSRGASEPKKELSGLDIPLPLAFTTQQREFSAAPQV